MIKRENNDLKKELSPDMWYDKTTLKENLFIWGFRLENLDLPTWGAHSVDSVPFRSGLNCFNSIWVRQNSENDELLNIETFECTSRKEAHDFIFELLSDFTNPDIKYAADSIIGDVSFKLGNSESVIVFARGNLVIRMRNVGNTLFSVYSDAKKVDSILIDRPNHKKIQNSIINDTTVKFHIHMDITSNIDKKFDKELKVDRIDTGDDLVWYKFFSPSGEFYTKGDKMFYRHSGIKETNIIAYAIYQKNEFVSAVLK